MIVVTKESDKNVVVQLRWTARDYLLLLMTFEPSAPVLRRSDSPPAELAAAAASRRINAHRHVQKHRFFGGGIPKELRWMLLCLALVVGFYAVHLLQMTLRSTHSTRLSAAMHHRSTAGDVGTTWNAHNAPSFVSSPHNRRVGGNVCALGGSRDGAAPLTILCVGDSITYGNGSHVRRKERDHEGNYPLSLEKKLRSICGDARSVRVINLGSSGKTLMDGFKQSYKNTTLFQTTIRNAKHAQLMIVMLGTNDSKLRHWKSKEAFENALVQFVEFFSSLNAEMKFVLVTPPPSFPDPRVLRRLKRRVVLGKIRPVIIRNDIRIAVMSAAERLDAELVDVYGEFDAMDDLHDLDTEGHSSEIAAAAADGGVEEIEASAALIAQYFHDGVHPSLLSHEIMASIIAGELTHDDVPRHHRQL
jgi:lysophospholipase L1-like esterase